MGGASDLPRSRSAPLQRGVNGQHQRVRPGQGGNIRIPEASGRAVAGRYLPSLDGLRAVAVAGVIAYHLGYHWAGGGYLGVDLFFVLSGFLITGLLVEEWGTSAHLGLAAFWTRRIKRLLPGLLVMLLALCVFVTVWGGGAGADLGQLRADALATVFYVANWHLLIAHQPYFAQFASPSPLQHTWSLAIEEQFYLLWPLVLFVVLRRHSPRAVRWRARTIAITAGGSLLSAAWMAALSLHGAGVDRLYYGTDTRAFDLLVGATLAVMVAFRPDPVATRRRLLHLVGVIGALVLAICWWRASGVNGPPRWMFEGGFLLCALAAAAVIADVRQERGGVLGSILNLRPLRWLGKISYGLYLWHWPVIVELTSARTGLSGLGLNASRVAVTLCLATISYYAVERPVRRARFTSLPRIARVAVAPLAMVVTSAVALAATLPAAASTLSPSLQVASLSNVPGAGGLSGQKPISLAAPSRSRAPGGPLRVMLLGDSVMYVEAPAVQAALGSTGQVQVVDRAFPGWGLSTDANWRHDVAAAVAEVRPEIVIAMWSWDNGLALSEPTRYEDQLEQFVNVLLAPGDGVRGVVFQQFPMPGPVLSALDTSEEHARTAVEVTGVKKWNSLVARLPALFPGRVMYFPLAPAVELDGHYSAWLPGAGTEPTPPPHDWVRVRMVDNVHLCPAGAARYADALLADMSHMFGLSRPSQDWSTGAWTRDPRFARAVGLSGSPCPDDHPST